MSEKKESNIKIVAGKLQTNISNIKSLPQNRQILMESLDPPSPRLGTRKVAHDKK